MSATHSVAGFELPHAPADAKVRRILETTLRDIYRNLPDQPPVEQAPFWDAGFFDLEKSSLFRDASEDQQREVLTLASQGLMEEAYFIEKAGVGYMSRMTSLAETVEERMLYATFAGDEVRHLVQVQAFLPGGSHSGTDDAFLRYLSDLVETDDRALLLFVLQVVLEGWGLSHYKALGMGCRQPQLGKLLQSFLADEARHVGTGLALFETTEVSARSRAAIVDALHEFLRMVQAGPQRLVGALEQVLGHLSKEQKVGLLEELQIELHSGVRLELLKGLMRGDGAGPIVQDLEERGAFLPLPAGECV